MPRVVMRPIPATNRWNFPVRQRLLHTGLKAFTRQPVGLGGRGDSTPDLRLYGVLAGTRKFLDAQMLLDPLEEQLHLPAVLVKLGNDPSRQAGVVGQKHQRLVRDWVMKTHTANMFGISAQALGSTQFDRLIADQAPTFIHGCRIHATHLCVRFGSGHEEGTGLMHRVQTLEIHVTPIHHIKSQSKAWPGHARCASRVVRWHRPALTGAPVDESPCRRVCLSWPPASPRYRAAILAM
jgi:hypothetical protein